MIVKFQLQYVMRFKFELILFFNNPKLCELKKVDLFKEYV